MVDKITTRGHDKIEGGVKAWTKSEWENGDGHPVGMLNWEIFTDIDIVLKVLKEDVPEQIAGYKKQLEDIEKKADEISVQIKETQEDPDFVSWKERLKNGELSRLKVVEMLENSGAKCDDFVDLVGREALDKFKEEIKKSKFAEYEITVNKEKDLDNMNKQAELIEKKIKESEDWKVQMEDVLVTMQNVREDVEISDAIQEKPLDNYDGSN